MAKKKEKCKMCPMLAAGLLADDVSTSANDVWLAAECRKNGCAWWDTFYDQCSIVSVSSDIANLANVIKKYS